MLDAGCRRSQSEQNGKREEFNQRINNLTTDYTPIGMAMPRFSLMKVRALSINRKQWSLRSVIAMRYALCPYR